MSTQPDQNALNGLHAARTQRYADALGWRRDVESGAIRAMLDEQVRRVMAVADAENDALRSDLGHTRRILERRTEALNRVITERDTLRAQLAHAEPDTKEPA